MHTMVQTEMPATDYHVQCYDCAVINPNYVPEGSTGNVTPGEMSISIMVTVSGTFTNGESTDASPKGFSENFVLVPNPDVGKMKNKGKHAKDFLIQNQNYRLVA